MSAFITIQRATTNDAPDIALMVGELLNEIMNTLGVNAFNFSLDETRTRLDNFIDTEKYFVFIAKNDTDYPVGFIALYECHALYAEGVFGTIPEFYVRPAFRSQHIGQQFIEQVKSFGQSRGWKRLEVTTPPLPPFDKTLAFYERENFEITGGRKLKLLL